MEVRGRAGSELGGGVGSTRGGRGGDLRGQFLFESWVTDESGGVGGGEMLARCRRKKNV